MLFAAVDPNKKDLKQLVKFLKSSYPGCKIVMFCNPLAAAGYVRSHPVDVLFTEIAMTGMSGFRLKEITEKCNPGALTVFISATAAYAMDALNCRVFDYMVKPVTPEKTRNALKETKFQPFIQKNLNICRNGIRNTPAVTFCCRGAEFSAITIRLAFYTSDLFR